MGRQCSACRHLLRFASGGASARKIYKQARRYDWPCAEPPSPAGVVQAGACLKSDAIHAAARYEVWYYFSTRFASPLVILPNLTVQQGGLGSLHVNTSTDHHACAANGCGASKVKQEGKGCRFIVPGGLCRIPLIIPGCHVSISQQLAMRRVQGAQRCRQVVFQRMNRSFLAEGANETLVVRPCVMMVSCTFDFLNQRQLAVRVPNHGFRWVKCSEA